MTITSRPWERAVSTERHQHEQDGLRVRAGRRPEANQKLRQRLAEQPRCSDCEFLPGKYRVPSGECLCWVCVYEAAAPRSADERLNRRIAVQRKVADSMRVRA
jgi:hypothetical protein